MPNARADDPLYLQIAFKNLGLSEIEGARHEKRILAMYAEAGHPEVHDDETPWCAAFVGHCLHEAGLPNTGSLLAKSYAKYGTPTQFTGHRVPRGAICVWTRTGGNHVNFCLEDDGTYLTCIGGNQENGKGGGVTISRRAKSSGLIAAVIPPTKKIKPKPEPKPEPKPAPEPPDVEPVPRVTPRSNQPDDPGPETSPQSAPAAPVPWWKQPFVWIGSAITGGALGSAQLSVDAQFLWGLSGLILLVAALFCIWVFAFPPRGKFWKGIFK